MSLNLYTYCFNNPVTYWDPTGHVVTGWDRDNLSDRQIATVCRATSLYNISNATGDKAGKRLAHQVAESTRNEVRQGTNQIGSASGYTYTVDDRRNATLYRGDSDLMNRNRINGTTTLNGSNYIPVTKANAIDIVRENILSLVPNAKVPSLTMGANNAQIILSAENQTSESLSIMTDSMYAEGIDSDVYFTLEEYLGDTDIANAYTLKIFDYSSSQRITEFIVPYQEGYKFDIKFKTLSGYNLEVMYDDVRSNFFDAISDRFEEVGIALQAAQEILQPYSKPKKIEPIYIAAGASAVSAAIAPNHPKISGDWKIEVSVVTNNHLNDGSQLRDYNIENFVRYYSHEQEYKTYKEEVNRWNSSTGFDFELRKNYYLDSYNQLNLINIR